MTAAKIGGWDGGAPGSSMGLACASLYGSHIGLLAEARIGPDQRIRFRGWSRRSTPAGSSISIWSGSRSREGCSLPSAAATAPARIYRQHATRHANARPRLERLREVPKIEVELIQSEDQPGGVSGLGMAVLAPAVANAIAAGTGKRLRNLAVRPDERGMTHQ